MWVQFFNSRFLVRYWSSGAFAILRSPRFQKSYPKETATELVPIANLQRTYTKFCVTALESKKKTM